jgi:hypothetical protein
MHLFLCFHHFRNDFYFSDKMLVFFVSKLVFEAANS